MAQQALVPEPPSECLSFRTQPLTLVLGQPLDCCIGGVWDQAEEVVALDPADALTLRRAPRRCAACAGGRRRRAAPCRLSGGPALALQAPRRSPRGAPQATACTRPWRPRTRPCAPPPGWRSSDRGLQRPSAPRRS